MKSSASDLRKRGWISEDDLAIFHNLDKGEISTLIHSNDPCKRSAGATLADIKATATADLLLSALTKEKCLYTRLAICEKLSSGDCRTAEKMLGYLGSIGSNQYRKPADRPSKKKCYPLPRDIIARTLGRMDKAVAPVLYDALYTLEEGQLSELISGIGYHTYTHPELATEENLQKLSALLETSQHSDFLVWRVMICLSVFPLQESRRTLQKYADRKGIIGMEARRSLEMLKDNGG